MRFERIEDVEEYARRVWPFITQRITRNMLGTLLVEIRAGRFDSDPLLAIGLDDQDEIVWAGIRSPPFYLLASELDPESAGQLVDWWLEFDPELNGVDGPPEVGASIAAAWAERTGGTVRVKLREARHELEQVTDPPHGTAPGELRLATPEDRELLIEWMTAFGEEAGLPPGNRQRTARGVDNRTARGCLLIWDDGEPVSFLGVTSEVAGVVRIGPVYTPPSLRGRGYASSMVAATSQRALDDGADRCMLFTDVTNPTSNKIYADVGFKRTGDWEMRVFER